MVETPTPAVLYGHPGAESLDTSLLANVERQWELHLDAWRHATYPKLPVGLPGPLTMTIEEWSVSPPESHLPSPATIVEYVLEYGADNETDEFWCEQAEDAAFTPAVLAIAEALRLAIAAGIRYRMANDLVATVTITRTAKWSDGHSGDRVVEDSEPVRVVHSGLPTNRGPADG